MNVGRHHGKNDERLKEVSHAYDLPQQRLCFGLQLAADCLDGPHSRRDRLAADGWRNDVGQRRRRVV